MNMKNIVEDIWLAHYQQHNADWWKSAPPGYPGGCSAEYRSVMLHVFRERGIDWRAQLSQDEIKDAENTLSIILKNFEY